jgi:UDP-glucose 4-epimerase
LVERLLADGHQVLVVDNLSTGRLANLNAVASHSRFEFQQADIRDPGVARDAVFGQDYVFHLAAAVGVKRILERPLEALETNVLGTHNVLQACADVDCPVLIASTSEVYGKNDSDALRESDDRIIGPTEAYRWSYAVAKSLDESMALAFHAERRLRSITVRLFNTVGERQVGEYGMVVPTLVRQALGNDPVTVYGDGSQTRCFTYVGDVVDILVRLSDTPAAVGQIVNIGRPDEISIRDLADLIITLTGSTSTVTFVPYEQAYGSGYQDMRRRVPDVTRLRALVGTTPQTDTTTILTRVIEFQRQQMTVYR